MTGKFGFTNDSPCQLNSVLTTSSMSEQDATKAALIQSIKKSQSALISATQSLVQAPSPNPPGVVSAAADAAVALIKEHIPSSVISIYETSPGITNVVAVLQSKQPGRTLVLSGHLDTYPIGDPSQWSVPPLGGSLSADSTRIYGRGAADMKGGIAASIIAMRALAEQIDAWDGQVVLALAGDEETMGTQGTAWLLENVPIIKNADAVIVGDAGSPLILRIGEKGLLWLEVTATGKAAHGAHVHRGTNAIDALIEAIRRIKTLEQLPTPADQVSQTVLAATPLSEPLSGTGEARVLTRVTVNTGTFSGGTSMNLVPASASAKLDVRIPHGISTAKAVRCISEALASSPSLDGISCRIIQQYDPTWTSPSEEIVQCALAAARELVGTQATVNMRVGASDARLYRAKGIPTVVLGLTPGNMGGPDEYCLVGEVEQVALVHGVAAFEYLKRRV